MHITMARKILGNFYQLILTRHASQNFSHAPMQNSGCRIIDYPDSLLTGGVEDLFLLEIDIASPGAVNIISASKELLTLVLTICKTSHWRI